MNDKITEILRNIKNIAVVGYSHNPEKTSHAIAQKLALEGYGVCGVNPSGGTAFNKPVYKTLDEVPFDFESIVFFRPGAEVNQFLPALLKRKNLKLVWLQLGITNEETQAAMEATKVHFIQNKCMAVELSLRGGLAAIRGKHP